MPIKLLALDMDGTIVADLATISSQIKEVIQAAMEKGVYVTLATGREYEVTAKFAKDLQINTPIICYQGGLVQDYRTNKTLLARFIPADISRQIIKFGRKKKLNLILYTRRTPYTELPSNLMEHTFKQAASPFVIVNNLLTILGQGQLPFKFLSIQQEKNTHRIYQLLAQEFEQEVTITTSLETIVEITPPKVTKGDALQHLAKHLNIPMSQTMAIGDQDNDIEMLKIAGLGIAMGNASAGAKQVATAIAPPISNDGAAWAIKKYILEAGDDSDT